MTYPGVSEKAAKLVSRYRLVLEDCLQGTIMKETIIQGPKLEAAWQYLRTAIDLADSQYKVSILYQTDSQDELRFLVRRVTIQDGCQWEEIIYRLKVYPVTPPEESSNHSWWRWFC